MSCKASGLQKHEKYPIHEMRKEGWICTLALTHLGLASQSEDGFAGSLDSETAIYLGMPIQLFLLGKFSFIAGLQHQTALQALCATTIKVPFPSTQFPSLQFPSCLH